MTWGTETFSRAGVPQGQVVSTDDGLFFNPWDFLCMTHACTPLWSRATLGVSEAQRDLRRHNV